MLVSLIAAVADNGTIGRDNDLPWKLKQDMRFFVETTRGHTVVTGRKNFDAMGRALPKRRNLVVTRDPRAVFDGAERVSSVAEALSLAALSGESECFIIGGAQIYAAAFPYAHRFYRTRVFADVDGDVTFPQVDLSDFSVRTLAQHGKDEENEHACVIELWERSGEPAPYDQK